MPDTGQVFNKQHLLSGAGELVFDPILGSQASTEHRYLKYYNISEMGIRTMEIEGGIPDIYSLIQCPGGAVHYYKCGMACLCPRVVYIRQLIS